jgi:hypothetical protein
MLRAMGSEFERTWQAFRARTQTLGPAPDVLARWHRRRPPFAERCAELRGDAFGFGDAAER